MWWLNKVTHNTYYILTRPIASWHALTKKNANNFNGHSTVVLVHNHEDSFSNINAITQLAKNRKFKLYKLPGLHDDIWTNPQPYVDLLKKL